MECTAVGVCCWGSCGAPLANLILAWLSTSCCPAGREVILPQQTKTWGWRNLAALLPDSRVWGFWGVSWRCYRRGFFRYFPYSTRRVGCFWLHGCRAKMICFPFESLKKSNYRFSLLLMAFVWWVAGRGVRKCGMEAVCLCLLLFVG